MSAINYYVIYDGNCHLCVSLVQLLETLDQGKIFRYIPMQDEQAIAQWEITPQGCELGMILIDANEPQRRWQGSDAAEEIGRLLPVGSVFVDAYRALPGVTRNDWSLSRVTRRPFSSPMHAPRTRTIGNARNG